MGILTYCDFLCLKNEAGRRFYVNQAVWDVMDYCEDVLEGQSFCVLPELVLARSSKASSETSSKAANKAPSKATQKEAGKKVDKEADKEAGKFGFSVKGKIMAEKSSEIVNCVTFLTGVADYALWSFGTDASDQVVCESFCLILRSTAKHLSYIVCAAAVRSMKILSRRQDDKIAGHIVTVETKRQLSTPGEIDAAIAQAAGECLVM